jgi:phosphoribosylformimino-5-aminoimidazole carboxamide ribonucleotide (ProFAR) isomerase
LVENSGIEGVITGRAIYEGTLDFREGQAAAMGQSIDRI